MKQKGFAPIIIIVLVTLALVFGGGAVYYSRRAKIKQPAACTAEAKRCPNGSYVSRTGRNCEFAACPEVPPNTTLPPAADNHKTGGKVFCAQDVKQCPDGSYISRVPPSCELKACSKAALKSPASDPAASNGSGALPADWKKYRNMKYGFQFLYPPDHTAYSGVDKDKKILTGAGPFDDQIMVAENEGKLYCCEPVVFKITIANEDMRLDDWMDQNLSKYVIDVNSVSRRKIAVAGKAAVEITQSAQGINSPHKIFVIQPGNFLVVVTESAPSSLLDEVFGTLKFIQ